MKREKKRKVEVAKGGRSGEEGVGRRLRGRGSEEIGKHIWKERKGREEE